MHLESKEKHAIMLKEKQRMNLMAVMDESKSKEARKAREDFRRPAFYGIDLAPGQQDPRQI